MAREAVVKGFDLPDPLILADGEGVKGKRLVFFYSSPPPVPDPAFVAGKGPRLPGEGWVNGC
jgi:hypothetical protein